MARFVLAIPGASGSAIARDAARHGHSVDRECVHPQELIAALGELTPDAALVSAGADLLTAELLAAADGAGVRLVALTANAAERRRAAALGLREVADVGAPWRTLERLLLGVAPTAASAVSRAGIVLAVWGPSGAPGRTSIAVTLAAEFAAVGLEVMLADADTHAASVAPALGLADEAPGFAAACRLAAADALTATELDRIARVYESPSGSFRVLTGIPRSARWRELTPDRVEATIAACRGAADVVVLDVASSLEPDTESATVGRNGATLAALAAADRVIAVGSADPIGLSRFLRAHPDLLAAAGGGVTVVMNRLRSSAIGLNPREQVVSALVRFAGVREAVVIPDDRAAFDAALLSGQTITDAAPRSPARIVLRELAARLAPAQVAPRPRRRRDLRRRQPDDQPSG